MRWHNPISRRTVLRASALALGTAAVAQAAQKTDAQAGFSSASKETTMPHIIVKMYPGRSEQQKKQLADAIVKDVMTFTAVGESSVSVAIEEISPAEWTEKVYKPDIQSKWDQLYKKPGY